MFHSRPYIYVVKFLAEVICPNALPVSSCCRSSYLWQTLRNIITIASRSDCASTSFCAYAAWRHRTCPNCAGLFQSLKDIVICGHQAAVHSTYIVYSLATVGRRALGFAEPKVWNSLPDYFRCSDLSLETFKLQLKTFWSHSTSVKWFQWQWHY